MKLIRHGDMGNEKPGVILNDGRRVDAGECVGDYDGPFFAGGIERLREWVERQGPKAPALDPDRRLGAPVASPGKIICIGLNFRDHARESGMKVPEEPVIFFKATTALTGPCDDLTIPRGGTKTDWEVELAVVIGKKAQYIGPEKAMEHVAGFVLHNDYSERAFQLERGGQWVKGKSCDTFAPLGPWLVTPDELPGFQSLNMWLKVNGEFKQKSNTREMIFEVPFLISYVSQFMSLMPGDILSTGTPAGVGLGFKPPQFLKPGDVVELGVEGLGEQRQVCRSCGA